MAAGVEEDFTQRINLLQAQDDEKLKWLKAIHAQLTKLTRDYNDSCNDLERERIAGRETQKQAAELKRQYQELQQSVEAESFVLVLIDADPDEYIFKDEYYLDPDGGRKAAGDLRTSIKEYLGRLKPELARLPIVIKAFANGNGISKFLSQAGIIKSWVSLYDFAKAFSGAHITSDFILVGHGSDRADKKIKGIFEQFVKNPTCRHIVFGACHDNGYVRTLEDFRNDIDVVERVTLLCSYNIGNEFRELPFRATTMGTIFRTTPPHAGTSMSPITNGVKLTMEGTTVVGKNTWAALARNDRNSGDISLTAKNKSFPIGTVLVNAAGHRIDTILPQPSQAAIDSWNHKIKVKQTRYCRTHHLDGNCRGKCDYTHGQLPDEEKAVYRGQLRARICHTGLACRDTTCHYGHNCFCKKVPCRFPKEMHGIDDSTARVYAC